MARKKKKKLSIKKILRFFIPLITIIIILINLNNISTFYLSKKTGYAKDTIAVIKEIDNYNQILDKEYSKTLENIINTKYYQETYINEYLNINYQEKDNFLNNISIFLEKGYNAKDINSIYTLNDESINFLIDYEYFKDLSNIINIDYFNEEHLERYLKYYNPDKLDTETTITYVNIGLDNEYYTNILEISNQDDLLILVNKYHSLKKDYVPSDLETLNSKYGRGELRHDAKIAFEEMCDAAKKDNITLYGGSGYRSYNYQQNLYDRYVLLDGKEVADTYSARAGHSEHQTGLAMDIMGGNWQYISAKDKEYTWLIENSYKYGFILRYPKGKEEITGYMYEEWHYRYLGKETAKLVYESGLTYDEYVAKGLIDKK